MRFRGFITIALLALLLLLFAAGMRPHTVALTASRSWTVTLPATVEKASPPALTARAAFLADAATGQELYSLNPDLELPNASTTKIATATIAIEHGDMKKVVTCSKNAAYQEPANIDMKPGEKISLHDLMSAMMIHSANDAAFAVAEGVSGSVPRFMALVNAHAARLHCTHTHFVTPNGLNDPKHYTCARDLATLTEYALRLPFFNQLIRTKKYHLKRSINQKVVAMHRSHGDRFLFKYPGADGVKTGYTHQAGRCYVGAASRRDSLGRWRLVSVVLHAKDTYADTAGLMDYGFKAYARFDVVHRGAVQVVLSRANGVRTVPVISCSSVAAILRTDQPHTITYHYRARLQPPAAAGVTVGQLDAQVDGGPVQHVRLATAAAAPVGPGWKRTQQTRLGLAGFALLLLGCSYGSFAKGYCRRRALLAARSRAMDPPRSGADQRTDGVARRNGRS